MELILGHQSRFRLCSGFTVLASELHEIQSDIKSVIISCLSGIIYKMSRSPDPKTAIERSMEMLGNGINQLNTRCHGSVRVIVCQATPRLSPDFKTHHQFAMVNESEIRTIVIMNIQLTLTLQQIVRERII